MHRDIPVQSKLFAPGVPVKVCADNFDHAPGWKIGHYDSVAMQQQVEHDNTTPVAPDHVYEWVNRNFR